VPSAQQWYWWQDEMRSVAWALSTARTGKVARWPRMTTAVGSATLPLPEVSGLITIDGRLDEPAWGAVTTFPVGPIFPGWQEGPFSVQVSACRRAKYLYLAVVSPRDLTGLGSLQPTGELFRVGGRAFTVEALPGGAVQKREGGWVLELATPVPRPGAPLALAFSSEVVRRVEGKLPAGLASLGLTRHFTHPRVRRRKSALWLDPFTVSLVPADVAVQLRIQAQDSKGSRLTCRFAPGGKAEESAEVQASAVNGVARVRWEKKWGGKTFHFDGCTYVASVSAEIESARQIAQRGGRAMDGPEAEARSITQADDRAWRQLYCRARALRAKAHLSTLDGPLLLVKRHPYYAGHIYDDYYRWHPGGGIYVLENPSDPLSQHRLRSVIDDKTEESLGLAVYRDPELSWDGTRVLFACKRSQSGTTSVYEIGLDGRGLRQLTQSDHFHDVTPCYLPDGRIVCTSTRPRGRVPCFNSGVDTLHTMNADGTDLRSISPNNVNEFDPAVLADGRILYGRWEYVDKTALYMQSLWTIFPDGTHETALFANNLAKPTAVLDARPVPGTSLVAAALTPHNGQAVGTIATIDPRLGKNALDAVVNFTPEYPIEMDQGLLVGPSDPWPLSRHDLLVSNNAIGGHGIIEFIDRLGCRELVHYDADISCYAPMLVRPRTPPARIASADAQASQLGRFLVLDVYQGLAGVKRGTIKRLRVIEETARVSEVPRGGRWWNQAFLVSWQGAYVVKNFLGTVPVHADGSAYFEAPPGRALYFEALDAEGREVQRMRTFVHAVPGVTRSCVGCHESKHATPASIGRPPALQHEPAKLGPESWGSGYVDYPTMVQSILDRHCVRCHGGEDGIAAGKDLSGGWTWAFNISYETLLKHDLVGFLRCHNSDVSSSDILPPYTIGSGAAKLTKLLLSGHQGRIKELTRTERDLIFAWMDGNSNYYGTWNYTEHATCSALLETAPALSAVMRSAGCAKCHGANHIGNDWVNLQRPEWSRILRAPMGRAKGSLGLGWCRARKAQRGLPLVTQRYRPPDVFHPMQHPKRDPRGEVHVTFKSSDNPHYQAMLKIIRQARAQALARARVDMPGAQITFGQCRVQAPLPAPNSPVTLYAAQTRDNGVELSWSRNAETIGLEFELHRGPTPDFAPGDATRACETHGFKFTDYDCPTGRAHYALVAALPDDAIVLTRTEFVMAEPIPPPPPKQLTATPQPCAIELCWDLEPGVTWRYYVYRMDRKTKAFKRLAEQPVAGPPYIDRPVGPGILHTYALRSVDRRQIEGERSDVAAAKALPEIKEPTFTASFTGDANGQSRDGTTVKGQRRGRAKVSEGFLDLRQGGHVTFAHRPDFDLRHQFSVECWVHVDQAARMPVILSCGAWRRNGWFLQYYNGRWRWHVGGVDCDGGRPALKRWSHVVGTFDGKTARVFENGREVAAVPCNANLEPWRGPLFVGQYGPRPGEPYQVLGRIARLKTYRRAVKPAETLTSFKDGPPCALGAHPR